MAPRSVAPLLCCLAAACGGRAVDADPPAPDGAAPDAGLPALTREQGGSRVEIIDWVRDDRPALRKELRDRETGLGCAISPARDGSLRCLPEGPRDAVQYVDAACTEPVVVGDPGAAACGAVAGPYVTVETPDACPAGARTVFTRGRRIATPATQYLRVAGVCFPVATSDAQSYFEAREVDPGRFTRFDTEVVAATSELGVELFRGDDGAVVRGTLMLLPGATPCAPRGASGGADPEGDNHCVPSRVAAQEGGFFRGPGCVEPLAPVPRCALPPGLVSGPGATGDCAVGTCLHLPAEEVATEDVTWDLGAGCTAANPGWVASLRLFRAGARVTAEDFPRLRGELLSDGRARWVTGGVELAPLDGVASYRTEAGELRACGPAELADGTTVCADWTWFDLGAGYRYFADPACSSPLHARFETPGPGGAAPRSLVGTWVDMTYLASACGKSEGRLRQVQGPHRGPSYRLASRCEPAEPRPDLVLWTVGPERPAAEVFPVLTARPLPGP